MPMGYSTNNKIGLPTFPGRDAWERAWQRRWSKVGQPGYELPVGGPGGDEREFLKTARTPEKERARLKRINDEFVRGFKGLFHVGPAVTMFGSARFKETHPYYIQSTYGDHDHRSFKETLEEVARIVK